VLDLRKSALKCGWNQIEVYGGCNLSYAAGILTGNGTSLSVFSNFIL